MLQYLKTVKDVAVSKNDRDSAEAAAASLRGIDVALTVSAVVIMTAFAVFLLHIMLAESIMRAWLACRRCCRLCIAIRRAASIEMGPMQKHEVAEHEVADAEESKEGSKGAFPNPLHLPPSTEPDQSVPSSQPLCSSSSRLRKAYDRVKRTLCTSSASSPPVIDQPDSCEEKNTHIFVDNPLNY